MDDIIEMGEFGFVRDALLTDLEAKQADEKTALNLNGWSELLLVHIVIPILVSLTSSRLSEFLKTRRLASVRRKEATEIIQVLATRRLSPKTEMDDECLSEAVGLLNAHGYNEDKVRRLYARIRSESTKRQSQRR